ncbi:MAG: signal peptidase I [Actinobacteria bacterium]|nr:signal peptidase I [Actinomycetota bacterium]MCG2800694.1 DUF5684 domain-containing protein [Cellulomonas sp.]
MHILQLLTDDTATSAGIGIGGIIGGLIGYIIGVLPLYGVFGKAGQPAWAAFVPIYNVIVLLKVVGRPVWWIILLIIPIVDIVIWVLLAIDLAKSFAKGTGFAVGLIFLSWIFALILWLGSAQYVGPAAEAPRTA